MPPAIAATVAVGAVSSFQELGGLDGGLIDKGCVRSRMPFPRRRSRDSCERK